MIKHRRHIHIYLKRLKCHDALHVRHCEVHPHTLQVQVFAHFISYNIAPLGLCTDFNSSMHPSIIQIRAFSNYMWDNNTNEKCEIQCNRRHAIKQKVGT